MGESDVAWQSALGEFDYLHMKEFGDPSGYYKNVKSNAKTEATFMGGLVQVISQHTRIGIHATVLLDDLRRSNRERNHPLNPYALAVNDVSKCFNGDFQVWR